MIYSAIESVKKLGCNYLFLDKNTIPQDIINDLRSKDYTVIIGQGEVARIKISW